MSSSVQRSRVNARALVVLPTFNEKANLERLVGELLALDEPLDLLVVDDASPDGTGELAERLKSVHPGRLEVLHRPRKLGLGSAYLAGFTHGLEHGYAALVTMDADLSHNPRHLPAMMAALRAGSDLVIGSRYVAGGATPDFSLRRRLLSWIANLVAHTVAGLEARDATSGYRCYSRERLEALPLGAIRSSGYSFLVEILFLVQRARGVIAEVPIVFEERAHGRSKISRVEIARAVATVWRLGRQRLARRGGEPSLAAAGEVEE